MPNIILSSPSIEKKGVVNNRIETQKDSPYYQAAAGLEKLGDAVYQMEKRAQSVQAAENAAQMQAELSVWLKEQEAAGNVNDLGKRLLEEKNKRVNQLKEKNSSMFYRQEIDSQSVSAFSSLIGQAENTEIYGRFKQQEDSLNKMIAAQNTVIMNNPELWKQQAEKAQEEINNAVLPAQTKAELIKKARHDFAVGALNEAMAINPDIVAKAVKTKEFEQDLSIAERQDFLNQAQRQSSINTQSYYYGFLYNHFRKENGDFDYEAAISYLRLPGNQKELGISSDEANKIGDMLYSQYTQDAAIKENVRSSSAVNEINEAVRLLYNGNGAQAISIIQNSENIKGSDKLILVEKLKNGEFGKQRNDMVSAEIAGQIARYEINTQEELLGKVAAGYIDEQTYTKMLNFLESRNKKGFSFAQKAIDQLSAVYGRSLVGTISPAEAASLNAMTQEVMSIYNELSSRGATVEEISKALSPEAVENLGAVFSSNFDDIIASRQERFGFESKTQKVTEYNKWRKEVTQAKPRQPISDFLKEKGL